MSAAIVCLLAQNFGYSKTIRAFNVFCNNYSGPAGDINEGINADKYLIDDLLREQISEAGWGVKVEITEIIGQGATLANMVQAWQKFAATVQPEDTVFVHFSGHGAMVGKDQIQILQFCDEKPLMRTEWAESIGALNCRLKIFITDCCSSFSETEVAEGDDPVTPWSTLYHLLVLHEGFVNVTAASPGESAWATPIGGYFTVNLHSDMQRYKTWQEVLQNTCARVSTETAESAPSQQTPKVFSLAKYTGEKQGFSLPAFIIPDSSNRRLTRSELAPLGLELLYIARNEIVARHGYDFSTPLLQNYFGMQPWYQRVPGKKSYNMNPTESRNAELIKEIEIKKGGPFIRYVDDIDTNSVDPDIFPYSSSRVLSRTAVESLSLPQLSIARNEIFARHGYPFRSAILADYFSLKPYYTRNPRATSPNFNGVERQNLWLIKKIERIRGGAYSW